jgi:hypothetical protein
MDKPYEPPAIEVLGSVEELTLVRVVSDSF